MSPISPLLVNKTSQSTHSNWVTLSEKCPWKLMLSYLKLEPLALLWFMKLFPLSEFLHSLMAGGYNQILQVIIEKASRYELDILLFSTGQNSVFTLCVILLRLTLLVLCVDIFDVSWFVQQNLYLFDFAGEGLMAPFYCVVHLAHLTPPLLCSRILPNHWRVKQLALIVRNRLSPNPSFRIIKFRLWLLYLISLWRVLFLLVNNIGGPWVNLRLKNLVIRSQGINLLT